MRVVMDREQAIGVIGLSDILFFSPAMRGALPAGRLTWASARFRDGAIQPRKRFCPSILCLLYINPSMSRRTPRICAAGFTGCAATGKDADGKGRTVAHAQG